MNCSEQKNSIQIPYVNEIGSCTYSCPCVFGSAEGGLDWVSDSGCIHAYVMVCMCMSGHGGGGGSGKRVIRSRNEKI